MVKCANCGYLAVRNVNSSWLDEAGGDFREKGVVALGREHGRNQYQLHERQPLCFVQSYNLREEIHSAFATGKDESGRILLVIDKDRECPEFTKWQQGFTPKEHREMLDRQAILRWQAERDEADKRWREKESSENRKWRFREFIVALVALAIIVLAATIERGGQPTINVITPNPSGVTIEKQP